MLHGVARAAESLGAGKEGDALRLIVMTGQQSRHGGTDFGMGVGISGRLECSGAVCSGGQGEGRRRTPSLYCI